MNERWWRVLRTAGEILSGLSLAISLVLTGVGVGQLGSSWPWIALASFVVFVVLTYGQRFSSLLDQRPLLEFGDPESGSTYEDIGGGSISVRSWRVAVSNKRPGTVAAHVAIKLTRTARRGRPDSPTLSACPLSLHRMNDNVRPYTTDHMLRGGDTLKFDVVAFSGDTDQLFLYRSDLHPDGDYLYCLSDKERGELGSIDGTTSMFTIEAFGEACKPARGAYAVYLDAAKQLQMERWPPRHAPYGR